MAEQPAAKIVLLADDRNVARQAADQLVARRAADQLDHLEVTIAESLQHAESLLAGGALETMARRLADAETRFETLFHASPAPIAMASVSEGRIVDVNERCAEFFGYSRAEMIGRTPWELEIFANSEEGTRIFNEIQERGSLERRELGFRRRTGEATWGMVSVETVELSGQSLLFATVVDLSERQETEIARRESDARKSAMLESALDAIVTINRSGIVIEFNPAAEKLFGFARQQVLGRDIAEMIIPAEYREQHRAAVARYMQTGEARLMGRRLEMPALRADGSQILIELTISPIHIGQTLLFTAFLRDIRERRQTEEVARERSSLASLISDVGTALTTGTTLREMLRPCAASIVRNLEAAFARIWTFNPQEAMLELQASQGIYTHLDGPHSRVPLGALKIGLIASERKPTLSNDVQNDARIADREWAKREGLLSFAGYPLLVDDRLVGVMAMFGRKRLGSGTQHALGSIASQIALGIQRKSVEASLQLRQRAMEEISQGILFTDPLQADNPIVYVNPAFEQITGYRGAEAIGRNCRFLQGPDSDPAVVAEIRAAIRDERPCAVELLNYKADGTPFWNAISITPLRGPSGRVTHFVGVQQDITESKLLSEQLRQSQKMEAIGRLAGGVAHDFNNLLTIIMGYSELALGSVAEDDPLHDFLQEIVRSTERAASLTGQLLAFSRKQVLSPVLLDLNAVIAETERMLQRLIGEDVELITRLDPLLGKVKADPHQIDQILLNLCVNARDAMPQGGRMTIETRNVVLADDFVQTHVDVRPGAYAMLAVGDNGSGMDAATKARIFEPFFTTKGALGTGMGLPTIYGIVKQSGGHLAFDSEPGEGTTFRIYLPRVDIDVAAESAPVARPAHGSETVLLVEDEESVRGLARRILQQGGYAVLEAPSGKAAISLSASHPGSIDILVTDVIMPEMSGRAVANEIKQQRPGLKVLYVSGYTDDAILHNGVLDPDAAFLQKPFTRESLTQKVRQTLDA